VIFSGIVVWMLIMVMMMVVLSRRDDTHVVHDDVSDGVS
jgi:hypothetical protein